MKVFFGSLFWLVGGLMILVSGTCSLFALYSRMDFGTVGIFGGIPFVIGLALWKGGQAMRRHYKLENNIDKDKADYQEEEKTNDNI
jgi:hypothetical protein